MIVEGRFAKASELDLDVVSFKHEDDLDDLSPLAVVAGVGVGLETGEDALGLDWAWEAALEKKPRMLCCLPVDDELESVEGVFAGVRAGTLDLSPIFADSGSVV